MAATGRELTKVRFYQLEGAHDAGVNPAVPSLTSREQTRRRAHARTLAAGGIAGVRWTGVHEDAQAKRRSPREEKGEKTGRTRRHGGTMTSGRTKHVAPLTLLVAALVAGGVTWTLEGTAFWVACGLAIVFVVAGIFAAGRASAKSQNERER